jgi:flagellum-specific peptidoglycan hydrolase FlgJ
MTFSWDSFVKAVELTPIQFPNLKIAYLSQSILESGRGTSFLFKNAGNPYGIKWRKELQGHAEKIRLITPTEPEGADWALWRKPEDAIKGYWVFISRPPYVGWEAFGNDPARYIKHLHERKYATDPKYVSKVTALFDEATSLIA